MTRGKKDQDIKWAGNVIRTKLGLSDKAIAIAWAGETAEIRILFLKICFSYHSGCWFSYSLWNASRGK